MPDATRADFEAHLRSAPDDLAGWSAYADFLIDQGDPRGEFLRVQLALEDPALPKADRKRLAAREKELLFAHYPEWLGRGLTKIALDRLGHLRPDARSGVVFRRGWVRELPLLRTDGSFGKECLEILVAATEARWLEKLSFSGLGEMFRERLHHLPKAWFANCLKHITIGDENAGRFETVWNLDPLAELPALEVLEVNAGWVLDLSYTLTKLMPNLRSLSFRPLGECPFDRLAENPTLGKLESLTVRTIHPRPNTEESVVGVPEIRALAASRHLTNLRSLTIHGADFGDEGCAILAASPILDRLTRLDLSRGRITDTGLDRLLEGFARTPELPRQLILDDNEVAGEIIGFGHVDVMAGYPHESGDTRYLSDAEME